jgi:folate-binding Fe-S cluster repair protein YgfZ
MTDNQIIIWRINGRGCLAVTGVEAEAFLNDLLTLDMATITADQVVPAILLTPQGRIIFDLLISRIPDGFRLECDEHRLDDLIKKLRLYRLRRDIALTPLDEPVFALAVPDHVDGWLRDSRFRDITASRYYGMPRSDQAVRIADDDTPITRCAFGMAYPKEALSYQQKKHYHWKPEWTGKALSVSTKGVLSVRK